MKRMIFIGCMILFVMMGCAPTKEVVIKDWAGVAGRPLWIVGEKWVYTISDSGGSYKPGNIIEYLGQEEIHGKIYHVFFNEKVGRKRYFTQEFHWALTSVKEKEGWRDFEFYNPPNKYFEFPLQVGKSWKHDLITTKLTEDPSKPRTAQCVKERKVTDYVRIEIKWKSYDAYKIEEKCQVHKTRQILWYAPSVKNWVKRTWYNADGSWWQEEMTNYEPK